MMVKRSIVAYAMWVSLTVGLVENTSAEPAYQLDWIQQYGIPGEDEKSYSVSADGLGNVYICGYEPYGGTGVDSNVLVAKYNDAGNLLWSRHFGARFWIEQGKAVSADALGNVYISGCTEDNGMNNVIVAKYDDAGNRLWIQEFGTSLHDDTSGVSTDDLGNVYVTGLLEAGFWPGAVSDSFVAKYDTDGNEVWMRRFNSADRNSSNGVSADGLGNVYISGHTDADLNGDDPAPPEAFLAKYDDDGNLIWIQQFGNSSSSSSGVSADGLGNVYVSGDFSDNAVVGKFDDAGTLLWTQSLGSLGEGQSLDVSADGLGNVYITGRTKDDLDGSNAGDYDAFVTKYADDGNLLWTRQFGSPDTDVSYGVSADGLGNVYFTGYTYGELGGPDTAGQNVFVGRLSPIPEPSTVALLGMGALVLLGWIRRRR